MRIKFKTGDIVEAFGLKGKVKIGGNEIYPVEVSFENDHHDSFTADGRAYDWHIDSSLRFISRPKRKVKKKIKGFVNVFGDGSGYYYSNPDDAHSRACLSTKPELIAVPVSGEYEMEVDDETQDQTILPDDI
ncbi:MAG: hypothetical protein KAR42_16195 [candidate division Zixibacteria bacterium]|nr:hypothetical protein [candidate division Zixibacteria bacterium]